MENLCEEIKKKECVNYDNEEVQDIIKAVDILMNRFINELAITFPSIKIARLILCGSMAEQTRLWRGNDGCDLEFNYLAVLKSWPGCEDFLLEYNTDGRMEVKFKDVDDQLQNREYVNLNPKVKFVFASNLHTCINEKCRHNFCALRVLTAFRAEDSFSGCQFCSVCMKTGKLTCIDTQLENGKLSYLNHLNRLRFLWTSKRKSISVSNKKEAEDIFVKYSERFEYDILADKNSMGFEYQMPEMLESNNRQVDEVEIGIDFNPVLLLVKDQIKRPTRTVVHTFGDFYGILCQNSYPHGNKNSFSTSKAHLHQPNSTSIIYKLVFYILKILAESKMIPSLDKDQEYMLFPKGHILCKHLWRISTCLCELKVLRDTSNEHRIAFCALKFLIMKLKRIDQRFKECFPVINQYEAKLAVINHIKDCKTPTVGAHVCFMRILHDIACCQGEQSMNHPFLHLDVYDILQLKRATYTRYVYCISLKVLLLILVNERVKYTVDDLLNDLLSIKFLFIWHTSKSNIFYGDFQCNRFSRMLKCALYKFIERRKMNTPSRDELIKVVLSILREKREIKIRNSVFQIYRNVMTVVNDFHHMMLDVCKKHLLP